MDVKKCLLLVLFLLVSSEATFRGQRPHSEEEVPAGEGEGESEERGGESGEEEGGGAEDVPPFDGRKYVV